MSSTIHDVLAALGARGVSFDLDRSVTTPVVVFDPPLLPEALELLEPWVVELAYVALGRYTRHAPTLCERCGFVSMARVVNGRGTATAAAGWRADGTCPVCHGRRLVVGDPDIRRLRRPRRMVRPVNRDADGDTA